MLRAGFRFLTSKKQARGDVTSFVSPELQQQARYPENKQPRLIFRSTYYWLRFFSARFCSDRNVSSHLGNSFQRKQKVREEFPLLCPTSNNSQAQNQAAGWIPAAELRFHIMRRFFPLYPMCCSTPSIICNRDCILFPVSKTKAEHPPAHPAAVTTSTTRPPGAVLFVFYQLRLQIPRF